MKRATKIQKKSRLKLLHQYYSYTGFYAFIGNSLKKSILPVFFTIVGVVLFNKYIYNISDGLQYMTETFSDTGVFAVFFASESFLGLLPPEIFIAWSKKTSVPIFSLGLLAILSYVGGMISYFIGKAILKLNFIKSYLENKMAKHLKNASKWGGFLIAIGALFPLPFSITCMAGGMIKLPFKQVLLYGSLRFVRFAIYGVAIFQMIK
ncbi:YqaA family protein [Lutibacter sp.]